MDMKSIKDHVIQIVEGQKKQIIDLGEAIYKMPQTGYKEFEAAGLTARRLRELGLTCTELKDIPGVKATIDTGREGPSVAILGELDSIVCAGHPDKTNLGDVIAPDRLFFHDMFKRAFTHVHDTNEGDDVSFRFYVWQLGYAMFPWTGLVPAGLLWWLRKPDRTEGDRRGDGAAGAGPPDWGDAEEQAPRNTARIAAAPYHRYRMPPPSEQTSPRILTFTGGT